MNITQYRELKAQEASQTNQEQTATPSVTPSDVQTTTTTPETPAVPEKVTIDGVGEVTLDELKNGYLRQKDYTQKTQEISNQRKETQEAIQFYEMLRQNPQLTEQLKQTIPVPPSVDPTTARVVELETKLYDMMLEREIEGLQNKYSDFEVREVLQMAEKKGITDLDDAYHLLKSTKTPQSIDTESLKKTLREQILEELKQEGISTQTLISSNDGTTHVPDDTPKLSSAEQKVAQMMKMSDKEYAKWRDIGNTKG